MRRCYNHKNKGFTLAEMTLVLGIASTVAVMGFTSLIEQNDGRTIQTHKAFRLTHAYNTIKPVEALDITHIQNYVKAYFKSAPSYSELNNMDLSKMFEPGFNYKTNNFDGNIYIAASDKGPAGTKGSAFSITYTNVPQRKCVEILESASDNFYHIDVNNQPLSNKNTCSRDTNSITFVSI